jgi:hypothetical protein
LSLLQYLQNYNSPLELQLNWTATNYDPIITETLELYGTSETVESDCTDLVKLHKLAIYCLWNFIKRTVMFDVDISSDGANIKRSQLFENATKQAEIAKMDCLPYLSEYKISVTKSHNHNHDEFGRCRHYERYY